MANLKKRRGEERGSRSPLRVPDVAVPVDREKAPSAVLPGVALAAGIILFLFLLRFAVDILLWVLVLALFALVLHAVMSWLAETELLSAPWLLIIVLTIGAATWMLWPGSSFQETADVRQYLPAPIAKALEWAEERSLTRRALASSPAPAQTAERPAGGSVAGPRSEPVSTGRGTRLAIGSGPVRLTGAAASRLGEPVTLVATVRAPDRSQAGTVQFFDGSLLLGEAALEQVGGSSRASFTATGLSAGTHRITAHYAGATSAEFVHTVAGG